MKTTKSLAKIFLVLVPHRDIRLVLRKYSDSLFSAGFTGAYSFPWVAPLATLSSPLTYDELKQVTKVINKTQKKNGKIHTEGGAETAFPAGGDGVMLFGAKIDNPYQPTLGTKTPFIDIYSPTVIGACLLSSAEGKIPIPPPELSFRAAAVANMFWQKLPGGDENSVGYKWKIGKLCWL